MVAQLPTRALATEHDTCDRYVTASCIPLILHLMSHRFPPLKHGFPVLNPKTSLFLYTTSSLPLQKFISQANPLPKSSKYCKSFTIPVKNLHFFLIFVHQFIQEVCILLFLDYEKFRVEKGLNFPICLISLTRLVLLIKSHSVL
jgi:hypothetical protein